MVRLNRWRFLATVRYLVKVADDLSHRCDLFDRWDCHCDRYGLVSLSHLMILSVSVSGSQQPIPILSRSAHILTTLSHGRSELFLIGECALWWESRSTWNCFFPRGFSNTSRVYVVERLTIAVIGNMARHRLDDVTWSRNNSWCQ